jgi:hypothetical protein
MEISQESYHHFFQTAFERRGRRPVFDIFQAVEYIGHIELIN